MSKRTLLLFLVVALVLALAACQSSPAQEAPAVEQQVETTESSPATAAPTATQPEPAETTEVAVTDEPAAGASADQPVSGEAPAGCTAVSPMPTPGPTELSYFPPVSENDWVQGPDDAAVTIIEYGDFQ